LAAGQMARAEGCISAWGRVEIAPTPTLPAHGEDIPLGSRVSRPPCAPTVCRRAARITRRGDPAGRPYRALRLSPKMKCTAPKVLYASPAEGGAASARRRNTMIAVPTMTQSADTICAVGMPPISQASGRSDSTSNRPNP